MDAFAYSSFKHEAQRDLLNAFRRAVLALKLDAQDSPDHVEQVPTEEVDSRREQLIHFLDSLDVRVRDLARLAGGTAILPDAAFSDAALIDVADRFIRLRPDVSDRLLELSSVRGRLFGSERLRPQDFKVLDQLQNLLEEEAAEGSRGLYRL
jgi:hypothetical protein